MLLYSTFWISNSCQPALFMLSVYSCSALWCCWCCCSHLYTIGTFNLCANSCGVTNSVTDITSCWRFCCYELLKEPADFLNIVEAIFSQQCRAFNTKYSQNQQNYTQKQNKRYISSVVILQFLGIAYCTLPTWKSPTDLLTLKAHLPIL